MGARLCVNCVWDCSIFEYKTECHTICSTFVSNHWRFDCMLFIVGTTPKKKEW